MTNFASPASSAGSAPRYGGNLIVAIDLGDAVIATIMAVEDALLCGLISESMLEGADAAFDAAASAAQEAPDSEDAYLDWLAEKWGYVDGDERRDALVSHFGRS